MSEERLEGLYERLLNKRDVAPPPGPAAAPPLPYRLDSLAELHFLDWHACALIARLTTRPVTLSVGSDIRVDMCARVAARVLTASGAEATTECVRYQVGDVLARFLSMPGWPAVWRDYQTSRDEPRRVFAGLTLDAQFPHLRAGFLTGIDYFQMGEYYAAHEDWESLWVRLEDDPERRGAQALIQLAGAHIHRLKGRAPQARKLYLAARPHLSAPAVAAALAWLDAPRLVAASDHAFAACRPTEGIVWPSIPLCPHRAAIPRKHR